MSISIKYPLLCLFLGFSLILGQNSLCGLSYTMAPVDESILLRGDTECDGGELFFIRSNVESSNPTFIEVCFFLRAQSADTRLWVERDRYNAGDIRDAAVTAVFNAFSMETPEARNPDLRLGVKDAADQVYGPPPMIDNSDLVNILLMDVRDNFSGSGNYVGGYFDPHDQGSSNTSNRKNIIYIDCDPVDLTSGNPSEAIYTLAHEYEHLIHYASDPDEHNDNGSYNPWLDEGLADLLPSMLGLGHRNFGYYLADTRVGLDQWINNGLQYYAKSALFIQYFYEIYGQDAVKTIFEDSDFRRIESLKHFLGDNEFDAFFLDYIQAVGASSFPDYNCLSAPENQVDMQDHLEPGFDITFAPPISLVNPYSAGFISIPAVAEKYEIIDFTPATGPSFLYNPSTGEFYEPGVDNSWEFDGLTDRLLLSKIVLDNPVFNSDMGIIYNLPNQLHEAEYDQYELYTFIKYGLDFYAVNSFYIQDQAFITGIKFKTGDDNPVTVSLIQKGVSYTPTFSEEICGPAGPGWTYMDLSDQDIFLENQPVYVEVFSSENSIGYSTSYPDNNGGNSNNASLYSTNGNNYSSIQSLSLGGDPLRGNWMIHLMYADSAFVSVLDSLVSVPVYPNPFTPVDDGFVTLTVSTGRNTRIEVAVYDIHGAHVRNIYSN
ncbi:MAG: hypothetical protein H8D46_04275, partial [FCB group bacterium]|nr:hypothetical protein [FCB group bacterium]